MTKLTEIIEFNDQNDSVYKLKRYNFDFDLI